MKLKNHTALITGAGRGIGRAIALAFAREGADVILVARTQAELSEVRAECEALGTKAQTVVADLAQPDAVDSIFRAIAGGSVDILVNNAAVGSGEDPRPVVSFDDAFWAKSIHVNLTVPYLLSKRVLPGMLKAKWGRIINISSIMGKIGFLHGAAYAASKHGMLGLTRSLGLEVAKEGITVNAICPGGVETRMGALRGAYEVQRQGKPLKELWAGATPMGRILAPDEISPMAVFLASADAIGITAQAFTVDAGTIMI